MTELLVVDRLGHRGDGIADTPTGPLYVPYALPGETVEVEPFAGHHDRRHVVRIVVRSPERFPPICAHFGICGGCAVQHLTPQHYRTWKRGLVNDALAQAKIDAPLDDLVDAHGDGRRRAVFHARRKSHDVLEVGFTAYRAHHIVPIDRCPVLAPSMHHALDVTWALAEMVDGVTKPLDIQVTATDGGLDVDLRGSGRLQPDLMARLAAVSAAQRLARLTRHGELVAQHTAPTVQMGPARVALPPGAFLQATAAGEAAIAESVRRDLGDARMIVDLFAGLGPFTLRLAGQARITAFDVDTAAIASLRLAAAQTSGLKPIFARVRDLFRQPLTASELANFDAAVFDPPRQGAQQQARALAAASLRVIVAVSCNPATFARDARILIDGGYRLTSVTPIDQFRYSAHVEIVGRFER